MAAATFTPAVVSKIRNVNTVEYIGTFSVTGSTDYASGGLVTDFRVAGIQSEQNPLWIDIQGIAGFIYRYAPGASIGLGKTMIFAEGTVATNAPLVEHTATTLAAGVGTDTIRFRAVFNLR